MTALVSTQNSAGLHRIVLAEDPGLGVYCLGFQREDSAGPEWDYLQDNWRLAKEFCLERWGAPTESWSPTDERPNR